jgi:hypothetical protein
MDYGLAGWRRLGAGFLTQKFHREGAKTAKKTFKKAFARFASSR